jgi:hypothetical protein
MAQDRDKTALGEGIEFEVNEYTKAEEQEYPQGGLIPPRQ